MELDKFKTKDVVIAPKPQKQGHRFLGTMIRRPGLTLFEYDSKSKIVRACGGGQYATFLFVQCETQ